MGSVIAVVFLIVGHLITPIGIGVGWFRWSRASNRYARSNWASICGQTLATLSALLAVGAIAYANLVHGFAYYAPALMRIYGSGLVLGLLGLVSGLIGTVWRNPLRWFAPLVSVGTLFYWLAMAGAE